MTTAAPYEVKPPSAVLAEDVICQSFIQSSSTLAYACLLIRRGRHDLAAYVLHSLEQKPASRFKDMVFYLQAQIGIETGDFAAMKRRLVPRVHQHPNDMVALSLLASCVHLEWEDWLLRNPALAAERMAGPAATSAVAKAAVAAGEAPVGEAHMGEAHAVEARGGESPADRAQGGEARSVASPAMAEAFPEARAGDPEYRTLAVPTVPSARPGFPSGPAPALQEAEAQSRFESTLPADAPAAAAPSAGDAGFGKYQGLVADSNTQALCLWNSQRMQKSVCRKPTLEPLVAILPQTLPAGLSGAIRSLDGGEIQKVCFSFEGLTVTTLHAGSESLGLVTGNLNQSLLTMVRAENIFLKGSAASAPRVAVP